MANPPPAILFGHGNLLRAVTGNGRIRLISAHCFAPETGVAISTVPTTIHDFDRFLPAFHPDQHPAPGNPALARRIRRPLSALEVAR